MKRRGLKPDPPPEEQAPGFQALRCSRWLAAVWVVLVVAWSGCSVKKDYKVLSFFFDGVPDPSKPAAGPVAAGSPAKATPAVVSRHRPFVDKDCKSCHSGPGEMAVNALGSSCVTCHKETPTQHRIMHEPVASGSCLWCHAPHEAQQPRLLRAASPDLCLQCHERSLLSAKVAEHASEKTDCMSCHLGHGGAAKHLLRERRTLGILNSEKPASRSLPESSVSRSHQRS